MMKTLKTCVALAGATAIGVTGFVLGGAGNASSAAVPNVPTAFSTTLAGTDFHTLDPHLEPMFVGGGGVKAVTPAPDTTVNYPYLEAGVDLPVGAKVTSVAATGFGCAAKAPTLVFGSYSPTSRTTIQNVTLTMGTCSIKTFTATGNPIATVAAGRRYAVDFTPEAYTSYPGAPFGVDDHIYGVTVKYTCTAPCVP